MSYYQETGRAGRDGLPGECLLLYAPQDRARLMHFIQQMGDQGEQRVAMKHLGEMAAYAETGECRRKILLKHFSEEYPEEGCGNCDNCLNPERLEELDATKRAQMFMSTIVRLRESFGMGYVIDVLCGSEARKILSNRHTEISTYGIGSDWPKKEWKWLGNALLAAGHILQRVEAYNTLQVTPSGWQILNGEQKLILKRAIEQRKARSQNVRSRRIPTAEVALPELTPLHQQLYDRLRQLRKQLADQREIPPYIIAGDRTLHEMAAYLPHDNGELLSIHGIGIQKADYYGPLFLKEIIRFEAGHGPLEKLSRPNPDLGGSPVAAGTYDAIDVDDLGETVLETGELFAEGLGPTEIAEFRGLAMSTIEGHLAKLILAGEIDSLDRLVPTEKVAEIRQAIKEVKEPFLRSVLEYLGEDRFTFFEIRAVRAFYDIRKES
jgi:ATP-dependent DNA helicase RecQ